MTAGDPVCRGSFGRFPVRGVRRSDRLSLGRGIDSLDRTSSTPQLLLPRTHTESQNTAADESERVHPTCVQRQARPVTKADQLGVGSDPTYHPMSCVLSQSSRFRHRGPLGSTTVIGSFRCSMTRAPPCHSDAHAPTAACYRLFFVELIPPSNRCGLRE